jgi:hypothetical protein
MYLSHALWLSLLLIAASASVRLQAAEACFTIHGRAHYHSGDGNLRIWHIGTHHDFEPDTSSFARVESWIEAGVKEPAKSQSATPLSSVDLFADFLICPTEPFKKGSVQKAKFISAQHRRYVRRE